MNISFLICTELFWLNCEWAQLDYKSEVAPKHFLSTVVVLAKLLKCTHQKVIQILCPAEFYAE